MEYGRGITARMKQPDKSFVWLPTDIEWYKGDILAIFDEME